MHSNVVPMIHVPDVAATADWYRSLGFTLEETNEDEGELNWARLRLGASYVMLNAGGRPSEASRRDVDLYVTTPGIDALYEKVQEFAEVVFGPNDAFYGMREFTIRDPNGFWITFGERQPG